MRAVFESRENRFLHIDGLRALSAIWMIGFHSIFYLGYFISKNEYFAILAQHQHFRLLLDGLLGVDAFFAISGFLITSILLNDFNKYGSVQLGGFYIRRFFRIFPSYLALLFICRFLVEESGRENVWANVFLVNNYVPISSQFVGWAWSLAIEGQFYFFFPVLMIVVFRVTKHPAWILFSFILVSLFARYYVISAIGMHDLLPFTPFFEKSGFSRWFDGWYDKTHLRYGGLLVGAVAAFFYRDSSKGKYFRSYKGWAKGLLLLSAGYFFWSITSEKTCVFDYCPGNTDDSFKVLYETLKHFMVSLITAGLILYCAGPGRRGVVDKVLSSNVWRPFSELSLSAYLLHPIVIGVFNYFVLKAGFRLSQPLLFCYIIAVEAIAFCAAFLMYFVIERPFRKLGRRIVAELH